MHQLWRRVDDVYEFDGRRHLTELCYSYKSTYFNIAIVKITQ